MNRRDFKAGHVFETEDAVSAFFELPAEPLGPGAHVEVMPRFRGRIGSEAAHLIGDNFTGYQGTIVSIHGAFSLVRFDDNQDAEVEFHRTRLKGV